MSAAGSTSPFVGPKPFEQDQADLFKGREHEIERLEALVLSRRAVLFYAASGVGKSSLVNAGLVPKLHGGERGLDCEVLGVVRVSGAEGSDRDQNVFTKSVLGQLKDGLGHSSLLDYLRDKYTADKQVATVGPKLVLLVIDQFEELFTTSPERWRDRLPFMKGLLEALEACAAADPVIDREEGPLFKIMHLRIVFCLREEYIAYLEQYYDLFPELRTARFRLEPLRREQARRAIIEPTRKSGRAFSADLVEEIINELIEAPKVTTHDARPKPKNGWVARLDGLFRRAFFHVPEVGHRDQQYVVEGEYVEPVQLQVICSDIWESAAPGQKVISRNSLPKDWSVDVGLGRFYDQAIDFACRSPSEPSPRASSLWSHTLVFVRWRSLSPIRMRKWISKSLITAMGTRAPVLAQDAEEEIPGAVLERLQDRYLLRLEPRFGADWLELAHDRLVGPITRSNTRHIAASNHKRVGAALLTLFALAGVWGWHFIRVQGATEARRALVADMKNEIGDEPDLGVLVQACARSHELGKASAPGTECTARAEALSEEIVVNEGLEQSVGRQPELDAYVHNRLGAVAELVRQGETYRSMLVKGQYFDISFETPITPSESDLKALPKCAYSNDMKGVGPTEVRDALELCRSSDLVGVLDFGYSAAAAVDDARQYVVGSQCGPEGCVTKLVMLNGRNSAPITIHNDVEPAHLGAAVSRIAASASTLVYAVCEQGSTQNCPTSVQVYKLSDDRRSAINVATLPGTYDIIAVAASDNNVAIAYRSLGGLIKAKLYPTSYVKPVIPWLPDGSRVLDVPFKTLSSLIFSDDGRYLVASVGNDYLLHWKLDGEVFAEVPWQVTKLGQHQFAQYMTVSGSGNIVATALGMAKEGNLEEECLRISQIKDDGVKELGAAAKCVDAGQPDRMPTGWNQVNTDRDGTILVAANSFAGNRKSILLRRGNSGFDQEDAEFPPDLSALSVSADGKLVIVGDRTERIFSLEEANGGLKAAYTKLTYIGTIDSSCVRVSGPQHRVSAISFYGKSRADFLVATQEGCLAFFEKGVSGWKPQLIDTQMPDLVTASVSPDSRWAALGGASGRIQIWDLFNLTRPSATFDAHLPWPAAFAWLSPGKNAEGKWMILGNSRFGPVGAWLLHDSGNTQQAPAVSAVFPPTWIDKSGIVGVSAVKGSLLAATTDGRLLQLSNVDTPQAIVDRLIDRACDISRPLVADKAYPPSTAKRDDDEFISELMNWSRTRCQPKVRPTHQEAKG
jgi:WD40 repeat protein